MEMHLRCIGYTRMHRENDEPDSYQYIYEYSNTSLTYRVIIATDTYNVTKKILYIESRNLFLIVIIG